MNGKPRVGSLSKASAAAAACEESCSTHAGSETPRSSCQGPASDSNFSDHGDYGKMCMTAPDLTPILEKGESMVAEEKTSVSTA